MDHTKEVDSWIQSHYSTEEEPWIILKKWIVGFRGCEGFSRAVGST